jgi:16S rRNA processing protein RimM
MYMTRSDGHYDEYRVEYVRAAGPTAVLKLEGCDDRTQAEYLRDRSLFVRADQIPPPAAGEYFIKDLLGLPVLTQQGESLGILTDVLELPAHDVYQVHDGQQELLIPAIVGVIVEINPDLRRIIVNLPEGLRDLE